MTRLAAKLFGVGSFLKTVSATFLRWLLSDLRHVAIVALAIAAAFLWFRADHLAEDRDNWKSASAKWKVAANAWQGAHGKLLSDVRQAQAAAEQADLENKRRVDAEQRAIIERTSHAYETRLAAIRADADRLQNRIGRAANAARSYGHSGPADMSGPYEARCRAFGAADCNQFFTALPDILTAASENTAKLIELQDFVRELLAIDWAGAEVGKDNPAETVAADAERKMD